MTKLQKVVTQDMEEILQALGYTNTPEAEKPAMEKALLEHFTQVVLETLAQNLNELEIAELEQDLDSNPDTLAEKVSAISALIPDLRGKLEEAVEKEFLVLKAAKAQLAK